MTFKIAGVILLLVGVYLVAEGLSYAERLANDTVRAQVYPLIAIFLALAVLVLQAEKHHRDRQ